MEQLESALRATTAKLLSEFGDDLLGILLGGSVAYGTPMPNSDIDLYVLIRSSWRQRRNELVEGVEVEMLINPVEQIRRELLARQPATVEMFARGRAVHDPAGVVREKVQLARQMAAEPRDRPGQSELYFLRYRPSDLLKDVEDLIDLDPHTAELLTGLTVHRIIDAHWRLQGRSAPKPKHALQALRDDAPELARLAELALDVDLPLPQRSEHLRRLCQDVLAPVGGVLVEGATTPEHLP